jgi:hypothetical protein
MFHASLFSHMIVWLLFHLHMLVLLNTQLRQWVRCESEVSAANINSFYDPGIVLVITDLTCQTHVDHVQQLFLLLSLVRCLSLATLLDSSYHTKSSQTVILELWKWRYVSFSWSTKQQS